MKKMKEFILDVNGFEVATVYNQDTIENTFIPLLKKWTKMQSEKTGRIIVFLAAPPAVGKTTLSLFLEHLSKTTEGVKEIQAIGLDGFHYHQDYIKSHTVTVNGKEVPMIDVKGCPETYDIDKLQNKLFTLAREDVKWPVYDRRIHDVIEDSILVDKDIVLIEGNWLLLNESKWKDLKEICDDSIFIYAEEELLRERLIQRKMKGGYSLEDAQEFYEKSDSANVRRVLKSHLDANTNLCMESDNDYKES